jgi:AcrR family transcriptional regulator
MSSGPDPSGGARPGTASVVDEAALQVFYERGYHGASIRAIAKSAGIGVATLFHYYPNKAAILEHIVNGAADAMQSDLDRELRELEDPRQRLIAATRTLVIASIVRQRESFVAQSEFRSLGPGDYRVNREKRRRIQSIFSRIVADGIDAGQFSSDHPNDVSRSVVVLGTSVALWYTVGQGLSTDEVADVHVEMALRLVGARVR